MCVYTSHVMIGVHQTVWAVDMVSNVARFHQSPLVSQLSMTKQGQEVPHLLNL